MIFDPMLRMAQTVHLPCTDTNIVSKRNETRFDMTHVTYGTFGANRAPILRKINTISKWTKTSYHLSLVTKEYHRERPK